MIHNENRPDPQNAAEWDQLHAKLRNQLHRMQNPPWWDLLNRWVNWSLRLERAYTEHDRVGQRWLVWGIPVRFLLVMALVVTLPRHLDDSLEGTIASIVTGMLGAYWSLYSWGKAVIHQRAYLRGYGKAQDEALDRLREQGRLRW